MGDVLNTFSNIGTASRLRAFPGFPSLAEVEHLTIPPRGSLLLSLDQGDLVTFPPTDADVGFAAFGPDAKKAIASLGLQDSKPVDLSGLDTAQLEAWRSARGLTDTGVQTAGLKAAEPVVLRATVRTNVWALNPVTASTLVDGTSAGSVNISVSRVSPKSSLPDPLGPVKDEFTIPRGTARAYSLAKGDLVQIIDVEGQQCSDFMAFRADGLDAGVDVMIDSTATRSMVRHAYPRPGLMDKFFDANMAPLLQVVQDTCGRHDTFGLACTARSYEDRGFPGHLNCSDNISYALDPYGVKRRMAWPAINFFWNTWIDPHSHAILTEESHSRPGDYVVMRALTDLVCVSTACPDDIDPINGWNPTDVHVRIYSSDTPAPRAVAYRVKEDTPMSVSRDSVLHTRTTDVTEHIAPARDIWTPVSYKADGPLAEYWACREAATLQDMSGLRKYDVIGPDAERLLQRLMTRDVTRLPNWRGTYALICDETGAVVDDGTLFRLGPHLFRWCCGTEESVRRIEAVAKSENLQVRVVDMSNALVNMALQGPSSRDILNGLIFTQPHVPTLDDMKWFGVTIARLNDRDGTPFMLSRSGYTCELGYEVFAAADDAVRVWDALIAAGAEHGIRPMGTAALEMIRIEAGLAASGAEFAPGHDAWESGLGFAVNLKKDDFIGKAALERNARDPRRVLKGVRFEGNDVPRAGAPVLAGERDVGHVTSATLSPMLGSAIAMVRLAVEHAETGTRLDVGMMDGRMKRLPGTVCDIPFVDPKRERARA